jgi:hypothetical protein
LYGAGNPAARPALAPLLKQAAPLVNDRAEAVRVRVLRLLAKLRAVKA